VKLPRYGVLLCTLLAMLLASPASATPIVSIQPALGGVAVGDSLTLRVEITGAVDVFAFQFDIGFDPSVLLATGPSSEGPFLPSGGSTFFIPGLVDNTSGFILGTADVLFGPVVGVNGAGTLAFLSFMGAATVIGSGTTAVSLLNVLLLDSNLSPIDATIENGSVTVNAVPEPASLLLLGSGLAAAWCRRVRRRA
jgi:PEP-CTERM motif-containing protein/cohesin domain-containing protein